MTSKTTQRFREALAQLPEHVRHRARDAYRLFYDNPSHPSLRFRQVHPTRPIYSARVGLGYRALGARDANTIVWFWIGTPADYDQLLRSF